MNTEYNPPSQEMDPALEQAMIEIRDDAVDAAVVEAAAARVWASLAAQCHAPLHSCADFQALIPEFKAGHLPAARALLVKDHLHECVACRRVYEGRVADVFAAVRVLLAASHFSAITAVATVSAATAVAMTRIVMILYSEGAGVRS